MRSWTILVSLAAGLALAACGGATKTTPAQSSLPNIRTGGVIPPPVSAVYTATLAPYKGGASSGSANVRIGINPSTDQLCWQFAQLRGVPSPTVARLYRTSPGAPTALGFHLGNTYKPTGCIKMERIVLGLIELKTHVFIVNIHDAQHPEGAVQGELGL